MKLIFHNQQVYLFLHLYVKIFLLFIINLVIFNYQLNFIQFYYLLTPNYHSQAYPNFMSQFNYFPSNLLFFYCFLFFVVLFSSFPSIIFKFLNQPQLLLYHSNLAILHLLCLIINYFFLFESIFQLLFIFDYFFNWIIFHLKLFIFFSLPNIFIKFSNQLKLHPHHSSLAFPLLLPLFFLIFIVIFANFNFHFNFFFYFILFQHFIFSSQLNIFIIFSNQLILHHHRSSLAFHLLALFFLIFLLIVYLNFNFYFILFLHFIFFSQLNIFVKFSNLLQ